MDLPLNPTQVDAAPQELIQDLPSDTARYRVLQAAGISVDIDDRAFRETLDELSQIELRDAMSQLRFAGQRTIYYYRIDDLREVSPDVVTDHASNGAPSGAYGSEVKTAMRDHDRIYLVCSVPDTGTQAQLSFSETDQETTVATFKPRSQLLAVRAPNATTADATVRAVTNHLELADSERISFLEDGFRGRFEDACVDGYSTLRLKNTNPQDHSKEVEIRSKEPEDGQLADVRHDDLVEDLLRRNDMRLHTATGLVSVPTDVQSGGEGPSLHPRVTIGFPEGWVGFKQFVPEQVLAEFDDVVAKSL